MGKLTILDGEPEVGKSTMTITFAAKVTRGACFPFSTLRGIPDPRARTYQAVTRPSSVILVGAEDDAADTVRPRLDAAGADCTLVRRLVQERDDDGMPIPFIIPDDVHKLRAAILECGAMLVVIDPITAFITDAVRPGSDSSNRKALMALADVGAETGAAILLVRHLNKASGMSAKNRGGGSIAFTALARSVLVAGPQPKDPDAAPADVEAGPLFALARTKGNLAPLPDSHGYALRPCQENADVAVVHWRGPVSLTADQVVGAEGAADFRKRAPEREEATKVLLEILADGPLPSAKAMQEVRAQTGVSEKTVNDARRRAGIETRRDRAAHGQTKGWEWYIPGRDRREPLISENR